MVLFSQNMLELAVEITLHDPTYEPGVPCGLPAGRIQHRNVWWQLELAGTNLDAGELADHPGIAKFLFILWR